jgi:dGTPase
MSSIRHYLEEEEEQRLSPLAAKSANAVREYPVEESPMRTAFQRDRDRILHSTSFRRLKHKTQVFIAPENDHYRTRLTHTLEVTQIARTVARALRLNEDLTEAIGLGHDLGHAPFGHEGEVALARVHPGGFRHNEQSCRIIEVLEKNGQGLNLTSVVREGILLHSKVRKNIFATAWGVASTLEGQLIKVCDSIAYINHDIDDAIHAGILRQEDLPTASLDVLGTTHSTRIITMVQDLVRQNWWATGEGSPPDPPLISMSQPVLDATNELREYLFEHVYQNSHAKQENEKVAQLIEMLYNEFVQHPDCIPPYLLHVNQRLQEPIERAVVDYIAGMTDLYAIRTFHAFFVPKTWDL